MGWISKDTYLTETEMKNNADIIINYYRSVGVNDKTIAGILANMQAESTISPILNEVGGGGGYGLVQWTPKDNLITACNVLGFNDYTSGDNQIKVILEEIVGNNFSIKQWYTTSGFISNYYDSGATTDMVGVTGLEFIQNTMNWNPDKLAIMFMAGYERPSYDPNTNHYQKRIQYANEWYTYMGGVIPPTPIDPSKLKRRKYKFVLFKRRVYG